jgi:hypothetical protein
MRFNLDQDDVSDSTRRRRTFLGLIVVSFAAAMAVIIGNRLSDEALAVLAGAVCGVAAAIPTSLIIVAANRRRETRDCRQEGPQYPTGHGPTTYPPVVVVAPPDRWQHPTAWSSPPPSLNPPSQRDFTVVGGTPDEQNPTDDY